MGNGPRDAMLQSIDTSDTVTANGANYGDDINRGSAAAILRHKLKAVFRVKTAFAAGNFTLNVYSAATATPTAIVASSPLIDRTTLAVGDEVEVLIPSGVLLQYTRLGLINSAISATGAMEADLVAVPYGP